MNYYYVIIERERAIKNNNSETLDIFRMSENWAASVWGIIMQQHTQLQQDSPQEEIFLWVWFCSSWDFYCHWLLVNYLVNNTTLSLIQRNFLKNWYHKITTEHWRFNSKKIGQSFFIIWKFFKPFFPIINSKNISCLHYKAKSLL